MSIVKKCIALFTAVAMLAPFSGSLSADNYCGSYDDCYTECRNAPTIGPVFAVGAIVAGLIIGLAVAQRHSDHDHCH